MSETDKLATQWRSISQMLDEALLLPASERGRWLSDLPAAHVHLRETLRHFLELQARIEGDGFLESPAVVSADTTPPAMLSPGDIVGPYRVIEELGTGGMGLVWLAERSDGKPRRRVALKLPTYGLGERLVGTDGTRARYLGVTRASQHCTTL
jgi:hypothetical protein